MTPAKRMLDLALALVLSIVLAPVLVALIAVLWATSGRPIFYAAERMRAPDRPFRLWKLRTMTVVDTDSGVSGGDKASRITPAGRLLRKTRADEIPQLWNVLKGDMSFVGPRPPLRSYVERRPDLYARVLRSRPGITGLATLRYHRHEERLLARCRDAAETDRVYLRRCVPQKARLDLIYQENRTLCFDLALMWQTAAGVLRRR
ncbi:sugar transferase [Mesobaculum littorinae]|uniref:Sugar transferase n=1 Tax=Mesobaculum littorinae TaxID=2486419 RepID=A0A438ADH3_9RHOB|nr:sugar transferase [Mesobaculum littorinae]RVV96744.1 sugar transferase [Mesobaculum littorinae]